MSAYRTIFLEPDWVHSAYYGWSDEWPDPQFRVLKHRSGPLQRRLIVCGIADSQRACALADETRRAAGPVAEVIVHDLRGRTDWPSRGFEAIGRDGRMLNVDTFVTDLRQSEADLLASMSQQCRRKIRAAENAGLSPVCESNPSPERLNEFLAQFNRMASERAIKSPDRAALARMFADGRAFLLSVDRDGAQPNFVVTYRAGDKAIFLYGVGHGKTNDGAGQLVQWAAMQALKRDGVHWYDLGGLPSLDEDDGLYRFKKGFGGELVDLGGEYRFRTALARLARLGLAGANRLKRVAGA